MEEEVAKRNGSRLESMKDKEQSITAADLKAFIENHGQANTFQQPHDSKCVGVFASWGPHTVAYLDFYTPNRTKHSSLKRFSI